MVELRAPYPWFGGKSAVVDVCWTAFDPRINNYCEPFYGSGAVLLGRPGGAGKIETINDLNADVSNFWRAVASAPDEVARWCDWIVSEVDMHARHYWLVDGLAEHRERMQTEPEYFDAKRAGWWVYGQCLWIGSGWGAEPNNRKHPRLDGIGKGVHANRGHAPKRQLPRLSVTDGAAGTSGVHRLPSLGNDRGIHGVSAPPASAWFRALQERLRRVRVACGDFERVLSPSILGKGKNVGGRRPCAVLLDAPYPHDRRSTRLYTDDASNVWCRARDWALEHGDDRDLRIALCGYAGDFEPPPAWQTFEWTGARGYAGDDNDNRANERIWFSPHCLPIKRQPGLFDDLASGAAR